MPPATLTGSLTSLTDASEPSALQPFGQEVRPGSYPSSGWTDLEQLPADPFGPDAQLSLQQWLSDDDLAPIRPTEAQAGRAQALADRARDPSPHRSDEPYRRALTGVYARLAATHEALAGAPPLRRAAVEVEGSV